jgi:hypothetical protein
MDGETNPQPPEQDEAAEWARHIALFARGGAHDQHLARAERSWPAPALFAERRDGESQA